MMNLLVIFSILAALNVNMVLARRYLKETQGSPECLSGEGASYRGTVSVSSYGNRCLKWSEILCILSDSNGIGNHNYCRNPNNSRRPWCYVKKKREVKEELCNIPKCKICPKVTGNPITTPHRAVDTERTCGERSEGRMNKIVGGSFVAIESQPWIAAIFQKRFLCGGSLIAPGWVLTAAHCFLNRNQTGLKVYLGKSDIKSKDPHKEQRFSVEKLIIHQKYNPTNYDNDIALLKISNSKGQGALKTPSVRTVCLPPPNTYLSVGVPCNIAGFGKEASGSWVYANRLKQATVRRLSSTSCKAEESYKTLLTDNMICAASPDWSTDSCKGDSGGPLVCEASGRMFLFGVVSWGEGCARENKPGVYTKVTHYNDWIADKTGLSEYTKGLMYPEK